MAWNHVGNLKGPKGADGVGGGSSAWADITGKPQLLSSAGWQWAILPGSSGTLVGVGGHALLTNAGTTSHPGLSNASLRQSLPSWTGVSAAAASSAYDISASPGRCAMSGPLGFGGFTYRARFSVVSTVAKQRALFGLTNYGGGWGGGGISPHERTLILGLGFDANIDTNYQIVHCDSISAATKVNTGIAMGSPSAVFDLIFANAPGSSTVTWSLKDINSGASASGVLSSNLPPEGIPLCPRMHINNGGTAGAVSCDVMGVWMSNYIG